MPTKPFISSNYSYLNLFCEDQGENGCIIEGSFVAACESNGYSNRVLMFTMSFIVCITLMLCAVMYVHIVCGGMYAQSLTNIVQPLWMIPV